MLEILLQHDCTQHIVLKDIYMCFTVDEPVLMDEFDGKIQTTVRKTLVYKFLPMLEEGVVYRMSYFTVIPNIPSYRATIHDYRLIFLYKTTTCQCESQLIPLHGLSLVPFEDVFNHLVTIEDDYMRLSLRKTISELQDVKKDGMFIVLATINGFVEDESWWYIVCRCHRAVSANSNFYYYDSYFCHVVNVTPRYRIKVEVQDATSSAVLVIFYHDAHYLLNKSCADLLSEIQKPVSGGSYPNFFDGLVGKILAVLG